MFKNKLNLSLSFFLVFLGYCYVHSSLFDDLEDKVSINSLFWLRDKFIGPLKLSDKISVLSWDNDTFQKYGHPDNFDSNKFLELMKLICFNQPRIVIIDKKFSRLFDDPRDNELYKKAFSQCRVATIAELSSHSTRTNLHVTQADLANLAISVGPPNDAKNTVKLDRRLLAAHPYFLDSLYKIGFANYREPGYVLPVASIEGHLIPHIGLAAGVVAARGSFISVDGKNTPLRVDRETFVNWLDPDTIYRRSVSIKNLLEFSELKATLSSTAIAEDDTVFVLPLMFTGSVDFHLGPYGDHPGGFVPVSVANSVLLNNWLQLSDSSQLVALLVLMAASFLVIYTRKLKVAIWCIALSNIAFACTVVVLFTQFHYLFRWFNSYWMMNAGFAVQFGLKLYKTEIAQKAYQQALTGLVSPDVLAFVTKNPDKIDLTPCEKEITVVFVDFISFSILAEQSDPKEIFSNLKNSLNLLSKIVHLHGGVVDKSLGDGLLCYFGYDPVRRTSSENHADEALQAAIEMQEMVAGLWASEPGDNPPCLPIRVGINSGLAMIGNVCDNQKIDLSIIGHTVNLAQRYESSCEPFKIMIGPTTRMKLKVRQLIDNVQQRKIKIKHYQGKYNAYELDPFEYNPFYKKEHKLLRGIESFRKSIQLDRRDERYLVEPEWESKVESENGTVLGQLLNYSVTGACIEIDHYLTYDSELRFRINIVKEDGSSYVTRLLSSKVTWGKPFKNKFLHGVEFYFDSDTDRENWINPDVNELFYSEN